MPYYRVLPLLKTNGYPLAIIHLIYDHFFLYSKHPDEDLGGKKWEV